MILNALNLVKGINHRLTVTLKYDNSSFGNGDKAVIDSSSVGADIEWRTVFNLLVAAEMLFISLGQLKQQLHGFVLSVTEID